MPDRGTRGAYRKEDRVQLPAELQKELVEKAAAKYGNCQELAKYLNIPKSSVHYYRVGRLTMPVSVTEQMLAIAGDQDLKERIAGLGITKDRTWANEYAISVYREMCRDKLRLPTKDELERDDNLRRKAAAIVSYVLTEGSVWLQKEKWGECAVNITFAAHETDLYEHFRSLCRDVFLYDIGPPQKPGNGAAAIRGFIYSRFVAEWFIENGVLPGDKSARELHLPAWIMGSSDMLTWIAALQPWCDGEGSVSRSFSKNNRPSFLIAQSRHTSIDTGSIPASYAHPDYHYAKKTDLARISFDGRTALDHCRIHCRSEILEDVHALFERIWLSPKIDVKCLALKQDGFWSCVWTIMLDVNDSAMLVRLGLVTQERKRRSLLA